MPVAPTYPGVYIEEVPSGVRTITGVATSITAFLGRAARGRTDFPVRIASFAEYQRVFGPLSASDALSSELTLPSAVEHYFRHGGSDALVVRVADSAVVASMELPAGGSTLRLLAASPGSWGNRLRASVNHTTASTGDANQFNLVIEELAAAGSTVVVSTETFRNVSRLSTDPRFVASVLLHHSQLVRVDPGTAMPADRPDAASNIAAANGVDGNAISDAQISAGGLQATRQGIWALDHADLFNLLYIPPLTPTADVSDATLAAATTYCQTRRALHVIDPRLTWNDTATAEAGVNTLRAAIGNAAAISAAVYFPRLRMPNPLEENRNAEYGPGGAVAGIIARTDASRGVWKAPAGLNASFSGVREFTFKPTDAENGRLNPLGLNVLRSFPVHGNVVWGARTLAGADQLASEWKYLPVRRTALFIEESLFRGTQWVVFEPNDEPLWAQIRMNVGAFMQNLFRQGAFQGRSAREAYFVKCDAETTTQNDINLGIVNIHVGFAPLRPAEFVIIRIQQMTGDIDT